MSHHIFKKAKSKCFSNSRTPANAKCWRQREIKLMERASTGLRAVGIAHLKYDACVLSSLKTGCALVRLNGYVK